MKLPLLILCLVGSTAAFAQDITFTNHEPITFTSLQGTTYSGVTLIKGNLDGLIWRNGGSGGLVSYTNLEPAFLTSLGIPTNYIEIARARAEHKKLSDAQYRAQQAAAWQSAVQAGAKAQAQRDAMAKQSAAAIAAAELTNAPARAEALSNAEKAYGNWLYQHPRATPAQKYLARQNLGLN